MTYPEAIQFLYGLNLFGANFGLENTLRLAARSGNPQTQLRFIHVAGTNGKGSTCAILESIYRAAGLRVGLFTSPHLVSFRERIQVNRQLISEADVARLVAEVASGILPDVEPGFHPGGKSADAAERVENLKTVARSSAGPGGWKPPSTSGKMPDATTFFEFVTVIALKYFEEQKCDLVIWETGLGGRLDATNIVTPLASVITNIALDHTQWLGDTLGKIASEKAGIIKPGVPVLTAATEPEVLTVIENMARAKGAAVTVVGQASSLSSSSPQQNNSNANTNWTGETPVLLQLHLPGEHQKLNAALALATVEVLQKQILVGEGQIRVGLQTVDWPGRLQLITRPNGQKILLDGAHNLAGAETLRSALDFFLPSHEPRTLIPAFSPGGGEGVRRTGEGMDKKSASSSRPSPPLREKREKLALIIGVLADKDWRAMCEILAPLASKIFTVPVACGRTADAGELAKVFQATNPAATVTALSHLSDALAGSKDEPFVVITGSLYLIGEALEMLGHSPANTSERGLNEWTAKR